MCIRILLFSLPAMLQYPGRDIYLFGEFTNYATNENSKMEFNMEKGAYEKTLLLKQGFYDYSYVTVPVKRSNELVALKIPKEIIQAQRMFILFWFTIVLLAAGPMN